MRTPTKQGQSVLAVWQHYRKYHPRAAQSPGVAERRKISARLKDGFTVNALREAIDGNHCSPWHCGENPGNKRYHSAELIFRSNSKVTEFIEIYESRGKPVLSEQTVRGLRGAEAWLEHHEGRDETD